MTVLTPLSLNQTWQQLPSALSVGHCHDLLLAQLDAPSFAVPIAARAAAGSAPAKCYAQVLFFPHAAMEAIEAAIQLLCDSGRIESFSNNFDGILTDRGFGFVLVVRPDDPALAPARGHQGSDACPVGPPRSL